MSPLCFQVNPAKLNLRISALDIRRINYSSKKPSSGDYLQQSLVPTMHYQKSLPRLPIPNLEDTMRRFLAAKRPLLSDHQFRTTEKIAQDFLNGVGRELHKELVAKDKINKHTSYISGPWLDIYLKNRKSLLHFNIFVLLRPDPKTEYNQQLLRATNLLCSTLRYMKTLRAGLLEPNVLHFQPYGAQMVDAYPLDMSQYHRVFNTTRIPGQGRDELFTNEKSRHVLVMRNGNMYVFDVVDRDGNLLKPTEIQAHLNYILTDLTPAPAFPIGILTSENRDVWAELRDKLVNCGNTDNLRLVDSAVCCLCLDDASMKKGDDMLHSLLLANGCNRWLDKSFSLQVSKSGEAGICMEHSWGDGMTMTDILGKIYKDSTEQPQVHPGSVAAAVDSASAVHQLQFNLDSVLKNGIKKANDNFDLHVSQLSIDFMIFGKGGTETMKKNNLSPDSMAQLAFQMGFLRMRGQTVPTSESCSMARFKHGRLEIIPSATTYTKQCSNAFVCQRDQHSVQQLKAMLYQCSRYHRQLVKEASMEGSPCQGLYCHLYGLRDLALSKDQELHSLYTDYDLDHFTLSTSTVPNLSFRMVVFAPDVPDGFGLHYCLHDNTISYSTTSYLDGSHQEFNRCVYKSLEDIFTVLEEKPFS
uniref:Carnitine palmitoyltransferase 2 n=1 Tax=Takifugu rubripes TaxID=31033 RepID=A0A674MFH0_TAKRU